MIGGVYAGGLPSANSLVSSGGAAAGAFRLLSGYAGWEPGQLAAEAERGAWHVVAASTAVVLDAVQGKFAFLWAFSLLLPSGFLFLLPFVRALFFSSFFRFFFPAPHPLSFSPLSPPLPKHRPPPRRARIQGESGDLGLHHGARRHRARGRARQLRLANGRAGRRLFASSERGQEEEREGAGALGV